MIKAILCVAAALIVGAFMVVFVVTRIENSQAEKNAKRLAQSPVAESLDRTTAVVVFSRSGNTAVLGRHIAQQENADFYRLLAPDYDLGLLGLANALSDARGSEAMIQPETVNLSQYGTVYLGSPIWLYSPAPPIWEFVDKNRFDGMQVVLFNTYNSKFEQSYIDALRDRIMAKGARSFEHRYVLRGRMGQQISTEKVLENYDAIQSETETNPLN